MDVLDDLVVVKRSGQRVNFNGSKIAIAIKHGFDDVSKNYDYSDVFNIYESILNYIRDNYRTRKTINVEDIQDIIEQTLLDSKYSDEYAAFKKYRASRAESRRAFSLKQQHKFVKAIEKVSTLNVECNKPFENLCLFGTIISKEYIKSYIMDNKYVRLHEEGRIYIHNLAYFNLGYINHIRLIPDNFVKDDCLLQKLIDVKSEVNGEVAIDNFDLAINNFILSKFKVVFKNNVYNYLKVIGIYPFINLKKIYDVVDRIDCILCDLNIFSAFFQNEQVKYIINTAYDDAVNYIRKYLIDELKKLFINLNNNICNNKLYSVSISDEKNFIGNVIVDTFCDLDYLDNIIFIYDVKRDYDINLLYRLLFKNIRLNFDGNSYFSNGLKMINGCGRGIVAYTSLNLARLGIKYKKLSKDFFDELDELIDFTKNEMLFVFESIGDKLVDNYQILFKGNVLDDDKLESGQKIRKVIKNGVLNVNLVGLKECGVLINDDFSKVIIKLIKYIRDRFDKISFDTKLNFSVSAVCDDSCSELLILDKTIYGFINNVTLKESYDNISVSSMKNILNDIKSISSYQKLLNGGNMLNFKISQKITIKDLKKIIDIFIEHNVGYVKLEY